MATASGIARTDERAGVNQWVYDRLKDLGISTALAVRLVGEQVDWHELERLIRTRGCPPDVAARILL